MIVGVRCGTPCGSLFSDMNPVNACKMGSIAGFSRSGPSCPKPEIDT